MAKIEFKMTDSLVRRVGSDSDGGGTSAPEDSAATPATVASPDDRGGRLKRGRGGKGNGRAGASPRRAASGGKPASAAGVQPEEAPPVALPESGDAELEIRARRLPRPVSVQTSVQLPPFLWDRLAGLAEDAGGLLTANRLLIALLETKAPTELSEAAADLDRFLAMPAEETRVREHWEERNVRLPLAIRMRLDDFKQNLAAAGLGATNRSHMIAACVFLRGPETAEDARELIADVRAEALQRALGVADAAPAA